MRILRTLLLLPLALAACKPHPAETAESPVVEFIGSGFSIEPGPGWIRVNTRKLNQPLKQVICQPALTAKGATIQVAQLGDRIAENVAMAQVTAAFEGDELAMPDTLKQGDFQAASGVRGKWVRYARHTAPDPARVLNHLTEYIVRTAGGRWVSIGALTDSVDHANEVDAMVKRTLREIPPSTATPRPK
jgi:hypothetical protein